MKQIVYDQLRELDYFNIRDYLDENVEKGTLEGIYQVDLPPGLHSKTQAEHARCQGFYFAVNLDRNQVAFELLIRSRQVLRCSCIGYATPEQRDYIFAFADQVLEDLGIRI